MSVKDKAQARNRHIGHRLRVRRRALNISQGKLGAALALSYQQIQKFENVAEAFEIRTNAR